MAQRLGLIALLAWLAPAFAVDLFGDAEQEFLHPDEAFVLAVTAAGPHTLQAHFQIAEGYYLYRDKMSFEGTSKDVPVEYTLPEGILKDDPLFGSVMTYTGDLTVALKLPRTVAGEFELQAQYQGCAEQGVCYPPQSQTLKVRLEESVAASPKAGMDLVSRSDQIAQDLSQKALILSFLAFVGFGLLLAFTPCVLPMIPILASVIANAPAGTGRAFRLSLAYVLAMASAYAGLGVVVGLTGANLQAYLQNVWIIGGFIVILLVLALSMFGLYELRLPQVLQHHLHRLSQRSKSGSYSGAVVMGFLGALIASPCVSPPLVGAMIHIAHEGSPLRGAVSLFGLGIGLGLPLLAFGAFEGRFLPRSGPWMTRIRASFGVLLLALAIWMMDRVVPGPVTLALSGLLLSGTAVFLRVLDPLPTTADSMTRLGKGIGVAFLIYGAVLLVGAASGGQSLLNPLERIGVTTQVEKMESAYRPIKTVDDLAGALKQAAGQPVLLDFYADWCVTCHELEAFTFSDPQVQQRMRQFVLLRADVTANDAADRALLESLGLFGPPAILFYAADGTEIRGFRTVTYVSAPDFSRQLDEVLEFAK